MCLLGMLLFTLTTSAQDKKSLSREDLEGVKLEGIEVVSHQTFKDVIPSQTLTGKELEKLNSLSVADALRYFSGLQVKDYGGVGGIKTVNIRSMGSQHLGVYYDGIELGNAQNGQIDLGQFSLGNVEEISLYNGQKSSLMQTASDYGNAGSVYIRTRRPSFISGKRDNFRFKAKYGISNMLQLGALWEHKFSNRLSASFNLGTLTSDGRYEFRYKRSNYDGSTAYDTTAVRQNGDVQTIRLEGNLHGLIERGSWTAKVYHYQSNRGIPGAIVNNVWRRGERQVDCNTFVQGAYQKDVSWMYSFRVLGKYANYYTHYMNKDETTKMADDRYRQQEAYASTTHALQLTQWLSASMAYDVRWSKLKSDVYGCPQPYRWTHMVSLATSLSLNRFNAQASILYNNAKDYGEQSATGVTPVGVNMKVSRFTPALFLNYYLLKDKSLSVRGFIKNNFRMPTFNDLYYTDVGNVNLRPEKATQYDVGVSLSPSLSYKRGSKVALRDLTISADGYYNTINDKIVAYPKGQQFRWTMMNLGKVHITGLDAEAAAHMRIYQAVVGVRLQYTYQKAIDVTDPSTSYYKHQIPYIPKHSGSAIVDAEWNGFTFTYSFIYTGERYNEQENIQYNYMQPWYTSDVAMSYRFPVNKMQLRATFEINNLFSQDYDVI
ncbi:MAG: TonB-dependent receptor, partial [Prevotella sp.]|nr:TonB-dependent receptor [Prevotella sp.]